MADNNQDFIQVLLEKIEKDDLPTNVFDVEGTDPLVLLGKMNEIIGQLENFQSSVNTSNTTANEALSKAEDAVDTSGQALSNANTALGTANQAIGTANTAIETANQSLETAQDAEDVAKTANQNSNQAVTTANEAKSTAENALEQVTQGLGTKVYDNSGNLLNETTLTGSNGINVDMDATLHKNFVISIDQTVTDKISQNETDISELQSANEKQDTIIAQIEDDVDNLDNIVKSKVQEVILTLSGINKGLITFQQLQILQADDSNYIILNDEIYRLADKQDTSGYRTYTHTAQHNPNVVTKSIRITISTLTWQVETRNIVDGESNQSIDGIKTFYDQVIFNREILSCYGPQNIRIDIEDIGSNYIRYGNGIQICWGTKPAQSSNSWIQVNFPKPFINTNYAIGASLKRPNNFGWENDMLSFDNKTTTGVRFAVWNKREIQYIAIGYWK